MQKSSAHFQKSSRVARLAAYGVDVLILFFVQMVVIVFFVSATKSLDSARGVSLLITFGYFWLLTVTQGATLGKMLFGLKVITADGQEKIDPAKGFLREVLGRFLSGLILGLGYAWILFDEDRQGWHDKIAGTKVIQLQPLTGAKKVIAWLLALIVPTLGILGVLVGILLVAINPAKQFRDANNTKRRYDAQGLQTAVVYYLAENKINEFYHKPTTKIHIPVDGTFHEIAKNDVDICTELIPKYIVALPVDPLDKKLETIDSTGCSSNYQTGYLIMLDPQAAKLKFSCSTLQDCDAEFDKFVAEVKTLVTVKPAKTE